VALALMNAFGWRGAFLGLGAIVLAGFPALFLLLRESPRNGRGHPQSADNLAGASLAKAARTSSFWMVLIAIGLGAGCLTAVLAHIVPILADRHFPTNKAIVVVSVVGLVGAAWMFAIGWLLDRVRSPRVIAPLYLVAVFGVLVIERGTTLPVLLAGGVMVGLGMGTEFGALSYFISRYFGLWRFGTIAGVMYMAVTVAQGFTPYLMDVDFDHHGSYRLSLHIVEGILVLGAAIVACLPPYTATRPSWRPASSAV